MKIKLCWIINSQVQYTVLLCFKVFKPADGLFLYLKVRITNILMRKVALNLMRIVWSDNKETQIGLVTGPHFPNFQKDSILTFPKVAVVDAEKERPNKTIVKNLSDKFFTNYLNLFQVLIFVLSG